MSNRVLVDGMVATKSWRMVVGKVLVPTLVVIPLMFLYVSAGVLAGVLWLLSLGHMNLLGLADKYFVKAADKVCGMKEEK